MNKMHTMVDFIVEISHDPNLRQAFYNIINDPDLTYQKLYNFFDKPQDPKFKYIVSPEECIRIIENKDRIIKETDTKNY